MLKNLTLILLLNTSFLNAQETFTVPEGSVFHDLAGDHFLTSLIRNGKVYLTERDADGMPLWNDSLAFTIPVDTVSNFVLSRFGNTDQYAAILQKIPFNSSDVNIYQFSKLNIAAHTMSGHFLDTIAGYHPVIPLQQTDTSTYLFFPWGELGFETRRLHNDMTLEAIAPQDSIDNFGPPVTARFRLVDDKIWRNIGAELYMRCAAYTPDEISETAEYSAIVPSIYPAGSISYRDFVNDDSLLVVSSSIGEWRFTFYQKNLGVIDSVSHYVPTVGTYTARYRMQNIVVNEGKIYIFAYNTVYSNWSQIFVYDLNFDLVCEIPISMLYDERQMLEIVNGRVYFKNKPEGSLVSLYEVNACMLTSGINETGFSSVSVYPNPVKELLHVQGDADGDKVVILDQLGSVVLKASVIGEDGTVDLSGLASGIYFVRTGRTTLKVVKE